MSEYSVSQQRTYQQWFLPTTILVLSLFAVALSSIAYTDSQNTNSYLMDLTVTEDASAGRIAQSIATTNRVTKQTIPYTDYTELGNVNMEDPSCTTEQYLNYAQNRVITTASGWKFAQKSGLEMVGRFSTNVEVKSAKPITLDTEKLFINNIEFIPGQGAGQKGDTGQKGETGDVGSPGPTGEKGEQGIQGTKGVQGVASVEAGDDGNDGFDGNVGNTGAKGATGEPGDVGDDGFLFNDPIMFESVADMNLVTGAEGEFAVIEANPGPGADDGKLYVFDDTTWLHLTTLSTPGADGDQGIQGNTIDGARGQKGEPGIDGSPGLDGIQGVPGQPGPRGDTGLAPSIGYTGIQGDQGDQGPVGEVGDDWEWTPANARAALQLTLSNVELSADSIGGTRVLECDILSPTYRGFVQVGYAFACPENSSGVCDCPTEPTHFEWFEIKSSVQRIYITSDVVDVDQPTKVYFELDNGLGSRMSDCVEIVQPTSIVQGEFNNLTGQTLPSVLLNIYVNECPVGQTMTDTSGRWSYVSSDTLYTGDLVTVIPVDRTYTYGINISSQIAMV